ncbi:hypothetical protein KJ980_06940 [Patescibacteria group bacterium]|nr:hypothetical protein [Patescibacteria group bacterium]
MKITKTKETSTKKVKKTASESIEKAKVSYEKAMVELAPFLPKTQSKEITTEGAWQKTSNLSLY